MNYIVTGTLQEKRGIYQMVINLRDEYNQPKQKWISTKLKTKGNKQKAKQILQQTLADYNNNLLTYSSKMRFSALLQEWLDSDVLKNKVRPNTLENYKLVINKHIIPYFEKTGVRLCDLLPSHLESFYVKKEKELSSNSVHKLHGYISSALQYAVRQRYISENPAKRVCARWKKAPQLGDEHLYNLEQVHTMLSVVQGDVIEVPITLIAWLGRSEAVGLTWNCVDFENSKIYIRSTVVYCGTKATFCEGLTKSDSGNRVLAMSERAKQFLLEVKQKQEQNQIIYGPDYVDSGFVCTANNREMLKPDRVTRRFNKLLKRNNLPVIRVHDLRHSAVSNLLANNIDIASVAKMMGHKDIRTTSNTYGHLLDSVRQDASNILSV